ncbi:MAG TPA: hypothetical protein VFA89_11475 [Terriglobales bacterium]|nr:hypothetical protein [Terriglobales bacterium]
MRGGVLQEQEAGVNVLNLDFEHAQPFPVRVLGISFGHELRAEPVHRRAIYRKVVRFHALFDFVEVLNFQRVRVRSAEGTWQALFEDREHEALHLRIVQRPFWNFEAALAGRFPLHRLAAGIVLEAQPGPSADGLLDFIFELEMVEVRFAVHGSPEKK